MLPKLMLVFVWIACLGAFLLPPGLGATLGKGILAFLVVAHVVECVVFLPQLRQAGGSLAGHLFQTFVFGMFHLRGLRESAAESGTTP